MICKYCGKISVGRERCLFCGVKHSGAVRSAGDGAQGQAAASSQAYEGASSYNSYAASKPAVDTSYKKYITAGIIFTVLAYFFFIGIPLLLVGLRKRDEALKDSIDFEKRNKKTMIAVIILAFLGAALGATSLVMAFLYAGRNFPEMFITFIVPAIFFFVLAIIVGIVTFVKSMKNKYKHRPFYALVAPFLAAFIVLASLAFVVEFNPVLAAPDFIKDKLVSFEYDWQIKTDYETGKETHVVTITGIKDKNTTHIIIPYGGDDVSIRIDEGAFSGCTKVQKLTIAKNADVYSGYSRMFGESNVPSTLEEIVYTGDDTLYLSRFNGFDNVTKLTADNVTVIAHGSNYSSNNVLGKVSAVSIKNAAEIGERAFYNMSLLESVDVSDKLTRVGKQAFYGCVGLTNMEIPDSVTSIGSGAFYGCSNLESLTIPAVSTTLYELFSDSYATDKGGVPDSLKKVAINSGSEINAKMFSGCSGVESITLPNTITSIGESAFYGCSGLTSLTIPTGVTSIAESTFSGCRGLTSLAIPTGVTSIGEGAFRGCKGLTSLTIPSGVTSIGGGAFNGCSGLTSITLPSAITKVDDYTFYGCSGLTSLTLPDGVISIGEYAFSGCSGLTSLTIPAEVTSIGRYAFSGCSSLTSITIPAGVTRIDNYAFRDFDGLETVYWNAAEFVNKDNYYTTFAGCSKLKTVVLGDNVTVVRARIFSDCRSITTVTMGDKVTAIENNAFVGCSSLTDINLPAGLTSIGNYAFQNCSSLTDIDLPAGLTSIGNYAFQKCSSLTDIELPIGLTSIADYAFSGCSGVKNISLHNKLTSIGRGAFSSCTGVKSIVVPDSVTSIAFDAFYGCSGLESITLPFIGASKDGTSNNYFGYIFGASSYSENAKCVPESLATVTITGGTSVGIQAFYNCNKITSIQLPNSVTSIGEYAFYYCRKLESITIPADVTRIGEYAFYYCEKLKSITIPAAVTLIGRLAFSNCDDLTSVTFKNVIGWRYSFSSSSASGTSIPSSNLINTATAATYLKSTYSNYFWNRSDT